MNEWMDEAAMLGISINLGGWMDEWTEGWKKGQMDGWVIHFKDSFTLRRANRPAGSLLMK